MRRRTKIAYSIVLPGTILIFITVISAFFVSGWFVGQTIRSRAQNELDDTISELHSHLTTVEDLSSARLQTALTLLRQETEPHGRINWSSPRDLQSAVNRIHQLTGAHASIFQRSGSQFIRRATTIPNTNGAYAVGTTLDQSTPAYAALVTGQSFHGAVYILGKPYITTYEPVTDRNGVGSAAALFVGFPLTSSRPVTEAINRRKILQHGFSALLDNKGEVIACPESAPCDKVRNLLSQPAGRDWNIAVHDFEPWRYKLVAAYPNADVTALIRQSRVVVTVLGLILVTLLAGAQHSIVYKKVSKPILEVHHRAIAIAQGKLDHLPLPIDSENEISDLKSAINAMERSLRDGKTIATAHKEAEFFINSVPSILIGLDATGCVKRWNHAAAEALGIAQDDVLGKTLDSCGVHWLRSDIQSKVDSLLTRKERTNWDDLFYVKDGEKRQLGLTISWISPPGNEEGEMLVVGADITEKRKAAEELRAKTALLEAQVNSTIDGILVVDDNGQKVLQNGQFARMFKVPPSLLGLKDDEATLQHVLEVVKHREQFLREVTYLYDHPHETSRDEVELLDGTILDRYSSPVIDDHGKSFGRLWIFRDITERKRHEGRLQQLSLAVEQSPVSVVITDLHGNITYVNRTFTECTGYLPHEVMGQNPRILNSGYSGLDMYKHLWQTITSGAAWRGEFRNKKKNGDIYWEAATITPIVDSSGVVTHFLAVKEDVTELKAKESETRQVQKLEAIGQLAAGIAHEINTPTQFVSDNLTFLGESWASISSLLKRYRGAIHETANLGPASEWLTEIEEAERNSDLEFLTTEIPHAIEQGLEGARRIAKIVRAMKEFSHPDSAEKTPVDLNKAIETTITVARNEWKYVAEVETCFDPDLPSVYCHPGDINQVVLNLIVNAAHAIKDKVVGEQRGLITVSTKTRDKCVEISIADSGTGIPEAACSRVFDPFFTTKEVGKGTGQGLALAHSVVVKKHGGRIWFETKQGEGTTFFFQLPFNDPRVTP